MSARAEREGWQNKRRWYTHEVAVLPVVRAVVDKVVYPLATVECSGLDNVPDAGPCIVASNHLSLWDVIFMGVYLPRHPFYMAKSELFKIPVLSWLIRMAGAFPVNRGENDVWAIRHAAKILEAGRVLCMFPEGTRTGRRAQLRRGKVGAVKLALEHRVPLVPVAILGTQNLRVGFRGTNHITIQARPALDVAAMAGPPPYERETQRELTAMLMREIAAMLPPENRGVYA